MSQFHKNNQSKLLFIKKKKKNQAVIAMFDYNWRRHIHINKMCNFHNFNLCPICRIKCDFRNNGVRLKG